MCLYYNTQQLLNFTFHNSISFPLIQLHKGREEEKPSFSPSEFYIEIRMFHNQEVFPYEMLIQTNDGNFFHSSQEPLIYQTCKG